jgi:hypothetical protein
MEHPETYEPQAPAPFRQVDGLYDWLKDGQFRYVHIGKPFTFSCTIGTMGHGKEPWQPIPLERWLKHQLIMENLISEAG